MVVTEIRMTAKGPKSSLFVLGVDEDRALVIGRPGRAPDRTAAMNGQPGLVGLIDLRVIELGRRRVAGPGRPGSGHQLVGRCNLVLSDHPSGSSSSSGGISG